MSFKESARVEYLDVMLFLIEEGYLSFQDASVQYWADFDKLHKLKGGFNE